MKRMLNPVTLSLKCFKVTVLCGAVLSLLGCVSATVQQVRERSTQISGGETLVILGKEIAQARKKRKSISSIALRLI